MHSRILIFPLLVLPIFSLACAVAPLDESENIDTADSALRRLDFLQSRSLSAVTSDGRATVLPVDLENTFSSGAGTFASLGVSSVRSLSWVGDANSYVDVFDYPLLGGAVTAGRVARFRYPFASNSKTALPRFCLPPLTCPLTPVPTSVNLDVAGAFGHQGLAVRVYDRGECSGESLWPEVGRSIGNAIAANLNTQLRARGLGATTLHSFTITPALGRTSLGDAQDRVIIRSSYDVATCNGRLYIDVNGSFRTASNAPSFNIETATLRTSMDFGDDACAVGPAMATGHFFDVGGLEREIADGVKTALMTQLSPGIAAGLTRAIARAPIPNTCTAATNCATFVRSAFQLGGFSAAASALTATNTACLPKASNPAQNECVFVPNVRRINTRVDGIELVLTSFSTDPFTAPLRGGGVCSRPEPPSAPSLGFLPLANPSAPVLFTPAAVTVP